MRVIVRYRTGPRATSGLAALASRQPDQASCCITGVTKSATGLTLHDNSDKRMDTHYDAVV